MFKLLLATAFAGHAAYAQFIPPTLPETVYPTAGSGMFHDGFQNASCYSMSNVTFAGIPNNLYVYSWDNYILPGPNNGIVWLRTDPVSGMTYHQGFISKTSRVFDLEVVFINSGGNYYVVASYASSLGLCYDIYLWDMSGLVPVSVDNVIAPPIPPPFYEYRRISLDAHDLHAAAIVWED